MSDEAKSLGRVAFEAREAARLRLYGVATKWEEQNATVHREWDEMAAVVVAEAKRRGM